MYKKALFFLLLFIPEITFCQIYKSVNASVEDRVENLLSYMTLDEKLNYIGGINGFYVRDIPRLGVPALKMSDGPVGVRNDGPTTAYPAGILSASTWNIGLVNQLGIALGKDARARGDHLLLGPGVNIYRAPMCGRNFEYFGEDPFLSAQNAVSYVNGVQSQGVVATIKHFACNNQEWNRYDVSSDVDERTLQEIYLPAFKAAVMDGKVGAVMNSYNLINGVHATQNKHLNLDILKGDWRFDGILMSDWGSTHSGIDAANGGLDLEMPSAEYMSSAVMASNLNNGTLSQSIIDDKVRRILRILFRFGFFDHAQLDNTIPANNPANGAIALKLAEEGIVLLKNQDSILPLNINKIKKLAVIGPNANQYVAGGGSSYTTPYNVIPVLQGLQQLAGSSVNIVYSAGMPTYYEAAASSLFFSAAASNVKGLTGQYYQNTQSLSGNPSFTRIDTIIDFHWMNGTPNISGWPATNYSIKWTGVVRPKQTGNYQFIARGDDGFRLSVNNALIINQWKDQAATISTGTAYLVAGNEYPVELDFYQNGGASEISLGWYYGTNANAEAINIAKSSDAVVVCVGFNSSIEGEGFDRPFALPLGQDSLINAIAKVNPNTIVIVNAGGNVNMQNWISNVRGLLYAWYPGQEGGKAIAEILFGNVNPSGKLPVSFEKKWEDNPTYPNYYQNNGSNSVKYNEGIFVGYRYYDSKNVEPMFPFGFGLSYTSFEYSKLKVTADTAGGKINYSISYDIKNTGSHEGSEVSQVYVGALNSSVSRPLKELKGFSKESIAPGATKSVNISLNSTSFAYYDISQKSFVVEKGKYKISVGSASNNIKLNDTISIKNNLIITEVSNFKANNSELFSFFPNPAKEGITFTSNADSKKVKITIYNVNGQCVDSFNLFNNEYKYDSSKLTPGLYICRFNSGNTIITKKMIID